MLQGIQEVHGADNVMYRDQVYSGKSHRTMRCTGRLRTWRKLQLLRFQLVTVLFACVMAPYTTFDVAVASIATGRLEHRAELGLGALSRLGLLRGKIANTARCLRAGGLRAARCSVHKERDRIGVV